VLRDITADSQDSLLAFCINAASQAIINFTEREFQPTDNDTRTINYDGEGVLNLTPWELRSVTNLDLVLDGQTVGQTLTDRFYKLRACPENPGAHLPEHQGGGFGLVADVGVQPIYLEVADVRWRLPSHHHRQLGYRTGSRRRRDGLPRHRRRRLPQPPGR